MLPKILHIYGPIWIHGYGLMVGLSVFIFSSFLYSDVKRKKLISDNIFFNTIFVAIISGIAGGRLIMVISDWKNFSKNPIDIFLPWVGGFGILGAAIGILITVPIYLKAHNIPILKLLDRAAIYAGILEGIGRIGCLFAGCCYGKPAAKCICAITFTNKDGLAPLNIPLHPTQVYISITSIFILIIIQLYAKIKKNIANGALISLFISLSSLSRFLIDFTRGDKEFIANIKILSFHQIIALSIFTLSTTAFIVINKRQSNKT